MSPEQARLEQFRRWRQAALWAPVLWFPLTVYAMAMQETRVALILGLSGLVFTVLARGVVWLGRCPRCEARFRDVENGFKTIWDAARCLACGLSLFELRRGTQEEARAPHR
ncbi:MAG: hypothetical protein AB8G23_07015 [Myxococcota bacterium]